MVSEIVPMIDLAAARSGDATALRRTSLEIDAALARSGFFIVTGHGVPQSVTSAAVRAMEDFFAAPIDAKMAIRSTAKGSPRGYLPFGLETLSQTEGKPATPDLKEGFGMGPFWLDDPVRMAGTGQSYSRNVWPPEPAFRTAIETFYAAMEGLTADLMALFAVAMDLGQGFFTDRFTTHNSTLRLIHYPPLDRPPAPEQLRAGVHTDYGALTILLPQDRPGGLQVRRPDGAWENVAAPPGGFVINIGDLMMRWSNDTWLSSPHRVVEPPEDVGPASRRYSMAYFCNPNDDVLIECLATCCSASRPAKHAPILAGAHRTEKIEKSKQRAGDVLSHFSYADRDPV
ncbi:MAG: isopenicillin N synthase family oxygenase [Proteobacteria bacterium]|nr:isopenicillin N synthase family oxygenase [Pseudomonadota bacterium]